ncbi:hypothetical protein, partial [Klebsiella pneumoniae]|uniref:hypothetical protein n=1 Tax=Klebsiella pneumoniae TaxID=573 RepID=UPI001C52935F
VFFFFVCCVFVGFVCVLWFLVFGGLGWGVLVFGGVGCVVVCGVVFVWCVGVFGFLGGGVVVGVGGVGG